MRRIHLLISVTFLMILATCVPQSPTPTGVAYTLESYATATVPPVTDTPLPETPTSIPVMATITPAAPLPAGLIKVPVDFDGHGFAPLSILFDGTSLWVGGLDRDIIIKVDPNTGQVIASVALAKFGVGVPAMAFDGEFIWALVNDSAIKVRAQDGIIQNVYYFNLDSAGFKPQSIVFDGENMWIGAAERDEVIKFSPVDGKILAVTPLAKIGNGVPDMVYDGANVWAIVADNVFRLRKSDGKVLNTINVSFDTMGFPLQSAAFDGTFLWFGGANRDLLVKVSPIDGQVMQVVELASWGEGVPDIIFDGKDILAIMRYEIIHVRPGNGLVHNYQKVGEGAQRMTMADGNLWMTYPASDALKRLAP